MDDDQEVKELVELALVNGTDSANNSRAASRVSTKRFLHQIFWLQYMCYRISTFNTIKV